MKEFFLKHKDLFTILGLCIICYFVFIHHLGSYPLLDADETRYADMSRSMLRSRDFITLYLDDKIFWDKPPLYFWLECLSFYIFKTCSEFSVRIPCVICALMSAFALYFIGKKLVSRTFGIACFLILVTSVEYVIFAKVAILDMVLTAFVCLSVFCGMMTYFAAEKNKKYCWWLFYFLSATASLAKGVPGIVIPFGIMFFIGLWKKNLREFFKPVYILPGLCIFLLIFLPWHIAMYKIHGIEFINEYVIKHHLMRFVGSETIGRMHSPFYFIVVFIVGFLPWTISFLLSGFQIIKKRLNGVPDFVIMNIIGFVFTFLFFSSAKTKLITYILPLYPFAAVIAGFIWEKYIKCDWFKKPVEISVYVTNYAFIIFGILIAAMKFFLPKPLYKDVMSVEVCLCAMFILSGIFGLYFLKKTLKKAVFTTYIVMAIFLSAHCMPKLFNIWYQFGQNDLMAYAKYARENHLKLAAFYVWERYSLQYYYDGDVLYYKMPNDNSFQYVKTKNFTNNFDNYVMVIEHEKLDALEGYIRYKTLKKGRRYDLIYDADSSFKAPN